MPRTTISDVKQIIATGQIDSIIITHIQTANELVSEVLGSDTTISTQLKRLIEMYLTAHFLSMGVERELGGVEEHTVGATTIKYSKNAFGDNLNSTTYGQTAKLLDVTGKLSGLGRTRAAFSAFGNTNAA